MDSLSVGIPSPPSIATGERWSQVNTDLRNDLRSRRPSFSPEGGRDQIGRVAGVVPIDVEEEAAALPALSR
jgi:hypothetical protein